MCVVTIFQNVQRVHVCERTLQQSHEFLGVCAVLQAREFLGMPLIGGSKYLLEVQPCTIGFLQCIVQDIKMCR